jgi:predicted RND superfamily exporter protein
MLESLLRLLCRHRKSTLLAGLVALAAAAVLASQLSLNDSPERWLPASAVESWRRFSEHYEYADTLAVGLHFHRPVRDDDIQFLAALRADLMTIQGIKQVIDASLVADQIEGVPLTDLFEPPADGRDDPFTLYRGTLFEDTGLERSEDGPVDREFPGQTLVDFILVDTATTEGLDPRAQQEEIDARRRGVVSGAYRVLEKHRRDDVTFHIVGAIVIQHELERIARRLVITVVPLSVLLTLLALGAGFRSISAVSIAILGGVWSVVVMLGGVVLAGWTLNVVTVSGPTLMAVIVITTTVHFSHYFSAARSAHSTAGAGGAAGSAAGGGDQAHFIRWVAVPCLGAATVTGVGFLMLAFNELGPARELGIELFAGAILAFLGAFLIWMAIEPFRAAAGRWLASGRLRWLQRFLTRRPRAAVVTILSVLVCLTVASRSVEVDIDPYAFFRSDSAITKALRHFDERKFGLYVIDVVLIPRESADGQDRGAAAWDEDRRAALEFQDKIGRRPEVCKIISTMNVRQAAPRVKLDPEFFTAWKRRVAYQEAFKDWMTDRSGEEALRISFMVYHPNTGFKPLVEAVRESLPQDRFDCIYTGTAVNTVLLSEGLVGGITRGLAVAVLVMSALCALLFRSLRLTLIAALPNAFPLLVVFGLMGAFRVPLNSGSAMVMTVALGVALNSTVHFVMCYRRHRLEGADKQQALSDTFGEIGRPIVLTSIVNCLGFGIFLLADFRPMYHFGLLASIAMVAALVGDLVLLPNLLKLFDSDRQLRAMTNDEIPKDDRAAQSSFQSPATGAGK